MSVMSSLRRSVYGVPPPEMRATKFRFYRKVNAERGDVHRRAAQILKRELARKEARRNGKGQIDHELQF